MGLFFLLIPVCFSFILEIVFIGKCDCVIFIIYAVEKSKCVCVGACAVATKYLVIKKTLTKKLCDFWVVTLEERLCKLHTNLVVFTDG